MHRLHRRRLPAKVWLVGAGLLVPVLLLTFLAFRASRSEPGSTHAGPPQAAQPAEPTRHPRPSPSPAATDPLSIDLAALGAVPDVTAAGPGRLEPISGEATTQPDLYAAEFVRRLLTQEYGSPRVDLLAWVQAESALTTEPLVAGLVPAGLRDRLALYSVTAQGTASAPVPSEAEWQALGTQQAFTTVTIEKVSEPLAWSNAVSAGRISDPGCTARDVAATITIHRGSRAEQVSVALSLILEGPPTQDRWGFVKVVQYDAIAMGTS